MILPVNTLRGLLNAGMIFLRIFFLQIGSTEIHLRKLFYESDIEQTFFSRMFLQMRGFLEKHLSGIREWNKHHIKKWLSFVLILCFAHHVLLACYQILLWLHIIPFSSDLFTVNISVIHHQHGSTSSFAGMASSLGLDASLRRSANENGFKGSKRLVPEDMASLINATFRFSLLLNYFPSFFQCEIIEKVNDPFPWKGVSADIFN